MSKLDLNLNLNPKRDIARKRWTMLAQVLKGRSCQEVVDSSVSVRRFNSFGLLSTTPCKDDCIVKDASGVPGEWFSYTSRHFSDFSMNIKHLGGEISAERLQGFNNTGNVCVWPSEEVMTYCCMKHVQDFKGQSICELGGGMTCLAGIALGICSDAVRIEVSDGNDESVLNLQSITENNDFGNTKMETRLIRWGEERLQAEDHSEAFDTVLCADCLFFDDGREALAVLIYDLLKIGGKALIFAPSRDKTFYKFADIARDIFEVEIEEKYDPEVWNIHEKLQNESDSYSASLHYPLMMTLRKSKRALSRDVTPESR